MATMGQEEVLLVFDFFDVHMPNWICHCVPGDKDRYPFNANPLSY